MLDVHVQDDVTGQLLIAFEIEQALWERKKGGWHKEFVQLCATKAKLRIICAYMRVGEGGEGKDYLRPLIKKLESKREEFENGEEGEFLIILGPEYNEQDPKQPWSAYVLSRDLTPAPLSPEKKFYAWDYIKRKEGGGA